MSRFRLPMLKDLFQRLFQKPETNPFPSRHLPRNMQTFLGDAASGRITMNPPVPVPPDARYCLTYNGPACIGCGLCLSFCPAHAIERVPGKKRVRLFLGQCIACGQCVEVCPKKCFTVTNDFLKSDPDRYSEKLVLE